jgi:archaetidylinositol phosphate synthase
MRFSAQAAAIFLEADPSQAESRADNKPENQAENQEAGFASATRVHKALTAEFEKAILLWMAKRTPSRITPDHLTALAFASQILAGAAYAAACRNAAALWLVNFFLVLNWLGDSLDGTLARVRHHERPRYGFYLDHMADTFGALALMGGLACSGYLHWQTAVGMLVCFYVLSIESYLATYTLGRFHLSHGLFGPTEIRILLVAGNIFVAGHPYAHIGRYFCLLFDIGGALAIFGMALMAIGSTFRHTLVLYQEERPK